MNSDVKNSGRLKIIIAALAVLASAVLLYYVFGPKNSRINSYIRGGREITENLTLPETTALKVLDGRRIAAGSFFTPLNPKNDYERIIVPGAKLTLAGAFELAKGAAWEWAPDAGLLFIKSLGALELSGRSSQWQLAFGSKGSGKGYEIIIRGDRIISKKPLIADSAGFDLPARWSDSGEAIKNLAATPRFTDLGVSAIGFYYNQDGGGWNYALVTSDGMVNSMPAR